MIYVILDTSSVLEIIKNSFGWCNAAFYSKEHPFGYGEMYFTREEEIETLLNQCRLKYYKL